MLCQHASQWLTKTLHESVGEGKVLEQNKVFTRLEVEIMQISLDRQVQRKGCDAYLSMRMEAPSILPSFRVS